jgi:Fe-S cluster assembly scaffold protein SufB
MFYLNARGVGKANAKKLLLNAFASEVTDKITLASLKDLVTQKLNLV